MEDETTWGQTSSNYLFGIDANKQNASPYGSNWNESITAARIEAARKQRIDQANAEAKSSLDQLAASGDKASGMLRNNLLINPQAQTRWSDDQSAKTASEQAALQRQQASFGADLQERQFNNALQRTFLRNAQNQAFETFQILVGH